MMIIIDIIRSVFYYSFLTGQFIVRTINSVTNIVLDVVLKILVASRIIEEDFGVFLQDLLYEINCIVDFIFNFTINIITTINNVWEALIYFCCTVHTTIINGFFNIISGIGFIVWSIKKLIVLFGAGVWFAITIIPLSVIYFTYYIVSLLQEGRDLFKAQLFVIGQGIKNFYDFIVDVPIESAAGLITALCIIYVFYQFYSLLSLYFQQILRSLWQKCIQTKKKFLNYIKPAEVPRIPISDKYCLICEERIKCILTLPCRHICMCNECAKTLRAYNGTCPICRSNIKESMNVFV